MSLGKSKTQNKKGKGTNMERSFSFFLRQEKMNRLQPM
jgi:hypothetical protein